LSLADHELAALFAGARLALDVLHADPRTRPEAIRTLERIVGDYEGAIRRLHDYERTQRP
jgi:hypothetical protein